MKKVWITLQVLFLALILVCGVSFAQSGSSGAIEGNVIDEEGTPLPGAEVTVSSPALIGGDQSRITDADGKFRFVLLPNGRYVVEATMSGFVTTKNENIRLYVGQTLTLKLTLKIQTLDEEVTVIATSPLVDVKDSQTLITNIDRETIETIGNTRAKDSTGLIDLAPGAMDSSVMGASARVSNGWQLDGMNVTWLAYGADGSYPDITILEEVQVTGIGANAEYGNFTGASHNLITKSGGNTIEGFADITYSAMGWTQNNIDTSDPKFSLYTVPPRQMWFDAHAGIGGPLIKDKLWFYVSGGHRQQDTEIEGFEEVSSYILPSFFIKLTFQASEKSRLQFFWQYEYFRVNNRELSPARPVEATYEDIGPDSPLNFRFYHSFTNNTFFELSAGRWAMVYEQKPNNGRDVSERFDYLTGKYSGNYSYWGREDTEHITINAKLTHHADDFLVGDHDFKFGVEYLSGYEKFDLAYSGGYRYVDNVYYGGQFNTYAYSYSYYTHAKAQKATVFVQDSWRVSDRITINPGIHYSYYKGTLPNVPDVVFKPKNSWEPRIGLTWDLFGDHTTAIKAHFGRYLDSIKTGLYQGADSSTGDWVMYYVAPDTTKYEVYREVFSNPTDIDPNIRMPHSDQFALSIERTLMKDMAVGATFIYRKFKNFIARVNTTATWAPVSYTFANENGQMETTEAYQRTSPSSADLFSITNPDADKHASVIETPENSYTGFTLFFDKRFSNKWMLHVDYTYGVAKGTHANDFSGGAGLTGAYQNPNSQINAYGNLPYDPTHNLQIYGTVVLPLDFHLSPRFVYVSGAAWTRAVRVPVVSGAPTVMIEPRGSQRLTSRIDFDLRLEKVFRFSEKIRVGLIGEVFNVLNRGAERYIYTDVSSPAFGKAYRVYPARLFRIAARIFF